MAFILIRYSPIVLLLLAMFFWHRARTHTVPEKTKKIYGWIAISSLGLLVLSLLYLGLSQ